MKYYETKEFRRLSKQWKKRLKKTGFKDIERNENQLSTYSYQIFQNFDPFQADYYEKCREFLETTEFSSIEDKIIWENHSEGLSSRQISAVLRSNTGTKSLSYRTVQTRIKYFEGIMLKLSA